MTEVVKFYPKDAAKNPDVVLERAMGIYDQVFVIGYDRDGKLDVRASLNFPIRDILFALEVFKFKVLNGDYEMRLTEREPE